MANKRTLLGRRTQEESERTRQRILDEAEKLFARLGPGVSVREIAKASGVRHHTLQHHFGNKESLYRAVLNRWDADLEHSLLAAIDGLDDFGQMIDTAIEVLFDFLLSRRDWVKLTSRAATEPAAASGYLQEKSWVGFMESLNNGQKVGHFDLDPRLLLITVEGITHNHVLALEHYRALFGKDVTDAKLKVKTKAHIKTVVRALLGVGSSG